MRSTPAQSALVHVNTILIQRVLSEPEWAGRLGDDDRRGLTPLFWSNINPYGTFRLDMTLAREGVPLNIIQRQLGHTNLGTTSIYLQGIDPEEIITAVRARRAPMMSASAGLRL